MKKLTTAGAAIPAIIATVVLAVSMAFVPLIAAAQQRPSNDEAAKILKDAKPLAEQGNANAQYNMGVLYDEGFGVERNYKTARGWYEKAATQKYAKAEHNLGIMYQQGHGAPADEAKAAKWFKRAAEHGEPAAQNNLAVMYVRGQGVSQSLAQAASWAARAAAAGNESAMTNLPKIVANLPHARIDGDNVNVRAKPNTGAHVLRQADRDVEVVVLDNRKDWSEILFPGQYQTGWVAGFLLAGNAANPTMSNQTASAKPTRTVASNDTKQQPADSATQTDDSGNDDSAGAATRQIDGVGVNIRAKPTTDSNALFQADKGDAVEIIGKDKDWRQVRFDDGRTGWVAGFLLTE